MTTDTRPKPFVFVLMPFKREFDDIYQLGIKALCTELGLHCERVDEQQFEGSIVERIYNQIAKADIVISDMTGRNENVFYETGYAHALGQRVILLTQQAEDIPFDLKHLIHTVYDSSITKLKKELNRRLQWYLENPRGSVENLFPSLLFYLERNNLINEPEIEARNFGNGWVGEWDLAINNASPTTIEAGSVELAIASPLQYSVNSSVPGMNWQGTTSITLPNESLLHYLPQPGTLLPECWRHFYLRVSSDVPAELRSIHKLQLRYFSKFGKRDYNFKVINV
jgi:hypothetical protein